MPWQDYKTPITRTFASHAKGNFADLRNCSLIYHDVTGALYFAEKNLLPEGRYADFFSLCGWTLQKWSRTNMDDSYGQTQDFCSYICDCLETIYERGEEDLPHPRMLTALLKLLDEKLSGFTKDTAFDFVLKHFHSPRELEVKEKFILQQIEKAKDEPHASTSVSVLNDYLVRVLAEQKRPIEEIRSILNPEEGFVNREKLSRIELAYGNIPEATALLKEAIRERPHPYFSDELRKELMQIYQEQGDMDSYREELYQMMMIHPETLYYYHEYKKLFPEEEWEKQWDLIVEQYRDDLVKIIEWLAEEGRYDLIMASAEPNHMDVVFSFEKELFARYPDRCLKVLEEGANGYAQYSNKRSDYRSLVHLLREISGVPGGRDLALRLADQYRSQYPRRAAMLEELDRF